MFLLMPENVIEGAAWFFSIIFNKSCYKMPKNTIDGAAWFYFTLKCHFKPLKWPKRVIFICNNVMNSLNINESWFCLCFLNMKGMSLESYHKSYAFAQLWRLSRISKTIHKVSFKLVGRKKSRGSKKAIKKSFSLLSFQLASFRRQSL